MRPLLRFWCRHEWLTLEKTLHTTTVAGSVVKRKIVYHLRCHKCGDIKFRATP